MERIVELSFARLRLRAERAGADYCLLLEGGSAPHIGCAVLALPRPSLWEDGSRSATASVLNVVGHKDEAVCRLLAERVAARKNAIVVCTGGFHVDGISREQIAELTRAVEALAEEI